MTDERDQPTWRLVNPTALAFPCGYAHGMMAIGPDAPGLLLIAGQIGWNREHRLVSDDFTAQFDQALANVVSVVVDAGGRPESIGRLTIYVTDMNAYRAARPEIGQAYRRHMGKHFPAMTLVEVKSLFDPGAKVEIEAVAFIS